MPLILTVMSRDEAKQQWSLDVVNVLPTRRMCEIAASTEVLRVIAPSRIVYWTCDNGTDKEPLNSLRLVGGVMRPEKCDRANTSFERLEQPRK